METTKSVFCNKQKLVSAHFFLTAADFTRRTGTFSTWIAQWVDKDFGKVMTWSSVTTKIRESLASLRSFPLKFSNYFANSELWLLTT